jgi:hypothetical protein
VIAMADINADSHTDILAIDKEKKIVIIHIFDPTSNNFTKKVYFKPEEECNQINDITVGRSNDTLRLFITCTDSAGKSILVMYDRNLNNELDGKPSLI